MYFKLLAFAKPYSRFVPKYTVLAICAVIFGLANFTLLIPLLNVIFDKVELTAVSKPEFSISLEYLKGIFNYYFSEIFTTHGKGKALQFVCVVIVVSVFFSNLFKYWSQRVLTSMRTYVIKNLRQAVYDKLVNLHVGYFHDQRKGNIMSSLSNDITEIESSIVSSIQVIFREPLMIAGFIILLFSMSVKLTLFSLIVLPISGFIISTLAKKLRKEAKTGQQLLGNILSIVDETISGIRIVKAFNAQEYVKGKFDEQNSAYRSILKSMWNKRELASPISEFLGVSVVVGILLYGGQLVLDNESELNASEFITYIVLFSQILVPAKAISSAVTNIQRGLAAGERLFTILESDIEIKNKPDAIRIHEFRETIEYRNVTFAYGDHVVLKNINLTVRKGETVALVGQSGAGKSTLADLLPRFYDVQSGQILIDGKDIRDIELNSLNQLMG
ncbi:MAG: ABC transporter ATP-binding protein, partial [Bacteroidota bacterium]